MNFEGSRKVKAVLDEAIGIGSVRLADVPLDRDLPPVGYFSLVPTAIRLESGGYDRASVDPHVILEALRRARFMAPLVDGIPVPRADADQDTPQLVNQGVYTLNSTSQFDVQHPRILMLDLNIPDVTA